MTLRIVSVVPCTLIGSVQFSVQVVHWLNVCGQAEQAREACEHRMSHL